MVLHGGAEARRFPTSIGFIPSRSDSRKNDVNLRRNPHDGEKARIGLPQRGLTDIAVRLLGGEEGIEVRALVHLSYVVCLGD